MDEQLGVVTQPTQQTQQSSFVIPQEYQGAGWVEKVKSVDDLWKTTANAQSLLGKRPAGIPTDDAPDEEWNKYYQALGRPESPDKYDLGKFDGLPEGTDLSAYEAKFKQIAHETGLSPKQAQKAWQKYIGLEMESVNQSKQQAAEQQAKLDKEFADLSGKLFGDQFDSYSKQAQEFLNKALPDELKPVVAELEGNPRALAAFIQLTKYANDEMAAVRQKYGAEDKLASGKQSAGMNEGEIRQALVTAKMKAAAVPLFSPEARQLEEEINRLRSSLQSMTK
jgi:hypothetical protein